MTEEQIFKLIESLGSDAMMAFIIYIVLDFLKFIFGGLLMTYILFKFWGWALKEPPTSE